MFGRLELLLLLLSWLLLVLAIKLLLEELLLSWLELVLARKLLLELLLLELDTTTVLF
jgi:hypothetical protein